MSNKILLIRPENVYNYNNYPPLNLISIGTELKHSGYDVKIINCSLEKNSLKEICKYLDDVLFVGLTLLTAEAPDAYRIVKYIKENTKVPVVVGGWHCTLFPEQMADCEYIDYVIAGEGERHVLNIADNIKNRDKVTSKIIQKEILDIETLQLPDYSIDENIDNYIKNYLTDKFVEYVKPPMRWLPYESSRGCPSRCSFCINVVTGNRLYRKKSAEKVVYEIEHIVKKYNLTHLKIIDDNFFVDIKRVRDIAQGIIDRGLNITWDGECRCDYFNDKMLNDETLQLCKESGLVQLTLGVESGSINTLKLMKKGITPEQGEFAVKRCNDYKIVARSSFMCEVPGETLGDIKKTIAFINHLRKYPYFTGGLGTFRPYPKCELTEGLLNKGYFKEPASFEEWTDRDVIDMYTAAEYKRPWQVDSEYSESASYYLSMAVSLRVAKHQIDLIKDKIINNIFIAIAQIRCRLMFFSFPFEKKLYHRFITSFYRRRQDLEEKGKLQSNE